MPKFSNYLLWPELLILWHFIEKVTELRIVNPKRWRNLEVDWLSSFWCGVKTEVMWTLQFFFRISSFFYKPEAKKTNIDMFYINEWRFVGFLLGTIRLFYILMIPISHWQLVGSQSPPPLNTVLVANDHPSVENHATSSTNSPPLPRPLVLYC